MHGQMQMVGFKRRSVLAGLASAGFIGASGLNPVATSTAAASGGTGSSRGGSIVGVEVIDLDTGDREFYPSIDAVDSEKLSSGRYEIVEVFQDGDTVEERRSQSVEANSVEQSVDDGTALRTFVETATVYGHVDPNGTATVWGGAVERVNGRDQGTVEGVDMEFELIDPDNNSVGTQTATTNEDGYASIEFDLNGADVGRYYVEVTSEATSSVADDSFNVGPYTDIPFHWTGMTPGVETTLGVYSAMGGSPESGVTRDIDVDGPEDVQETLQVDFQDGGIGMFSYTPPSPGRYRFNSPESNAYGESIAASALKAITPYFELRDQYFDDDRDTMTWGAYVLDGNVPLGNQDLTVTVENEEDGSEIETFQPTTNASGQFTIEITKPDAEMDYVVSIETADGDPVFLFGDRIFFEPLPSEAAPEEIEFDVSFGDWRTSPGSQLTLDVELLDDGAPVANQAVTLLYSFTYYNVPAGAVEVQTDSEGTFSTTIDVPADAPDGEHFYVDAITEYDGSTYTAYDSASLEQYEIDIKTFGLEPGTTNTLDVSVTDRATGDGVEGVDITVFGNREHVETETFDADAIQTDANGAGQLELTVPSDVTRDIMVNELTPYRSASTSSGSIVDPFSTNIEVTPEKPARGETVTVSFTTDAEEDVSALAVFPGDNGGDLATLAEGEDAQFVVPSHVQPGSGEDVDLLLISSSGEATEERAYIQIADELSAGFTFSPTSPAVDETVVFEETSTPGPDGSIESFEWDFGDGTTESTTDSTIEHSYDTAGDYDVTLTVTDSNGETDATTRPISVGDDGEDDDDGEFVNEDGPGFGVAAGAAGIGAGYLMKRRFSDEDPDDEA